MRQNSWLSHHLMNQKLFQNSLRYRPFHKTLPRSGSFVNWILVRFYKTGCMWGKPQKKLVAWPVTPGTVILVFWHSFFLGSHCAALLFLLLFVLLLFAWCCLYFWFCCSICTSCYSWCFYSLCSTICSCFCWI